MIDPAIAVAICDGHRRYAGAELIERDADPQRELQALMELDAVVLSHDGGDDPHFVFANLAASRLWRMPIAELIGMPSRLSAPPEQRASRSEMLEQAKEGGVLRGYSGERVAADGSLFVIEDATLWTVDYPAGPGQAVVFSRWRMPAEASTSR